MNSKKQKIVANKGLEELENKVQELTDALMRERADSQNIRRRHDEQIGSLKSLMKASVVRELLPVIDNFERALKHVPKDLVGNEYVKGVQGVVNQFEATLQKMGVERVKTVGEVFDPRLHEAISMEDGDGMVEVVYEELQPGFTLGEEVIRHAMVKVRMESARNMEDRSSNIEEEGAK